MSEAGPTNTEMQTPQNDPVPFVDLVTQYGSITPEIMVAVGRVFENQQFILGEEVAELEREVARYCDSQEAIGCASGTDALVLALMALDIGPGDEVMRRRVPSVESAPNRCSLTSTRSVSTWTRQLSRRPSPARRAPSCPSTSSANAPRWNCCGGWQYGAACQS